MIAKVRRRAISLAKRFIAHPVHCQGQRAGSMKRFLHRALVATWVLGNAPSRISSAFEFFLWIGEPFATLPPSKAGVRQFTAFPEIFFSLFFAARSFPHSSPDIPYDRSEERLVGENRTT